MEIWKQLRTVFAQSENLEATENYIRSIWKSGRNFELIHSIENLKVDRELYLLNLDIWKPIENYIRSIWTLQRLRTVFAQSENLEADWELYSLNLDFGLFLKWTKKIELELWWLRLYPLNFWWCGIFLSLLFHQDKQFCETPSLSWKISLFLFLYYFYLFLFESLTH